MDQKKTDYGNWVPLALMKRLAAIAGALLAGEVLLIVLDGPHGTYAPCGGIAGRRRDTLAVHASLPRSVRLQPGRSHGTGPPVFDGPSALGRPGHPAGHRLRLRRPHHPLRQTVSQRQPGGGGLLGRGVELRQGTVPAERRRRRVSHRVRFQKGDAAHLAFPDETFEAAVSNFVFHEVRTQPDKREVVREALRVVKKGGCFAFQDLFEKESLYGDMTDFLSQLRQAGVQELHYIPHVERQGFIPRYVQAPWMLSDVGLLYGRK